MTMELLIDIHRRYHQEIILISRFDTIMYYLLMLQVFSLVVWEIPGTMLAISKQSWHHDLLGIADTWISICLVKGPEHGRFTSMSTLRWHRGSPWILKLGRSKGTFSTKSRAVFVWLLGSMHDTICSSLPRFRCLDRPRWPSMSWGWEDLWFQ